MTQQLASRLGTAQQPLPLRTPPGRTHYLIYYDDKHDPPALVCLVGPTVIKYDARCIGHLYEMLKAHNDWMLLGSKDENQVPKDHTVEAWARSRSNPIGGWYGLKKGFRGRFAMYVPPLMEHLGLAEVEHNSRNNRMRAT